MKKIAAILLMGILLFNWCGYQLAHSWLEARSDRRLEAALDTQNYDEASLISFKVPAAHLSYYNSSTQFERVDGQIEVGGIKYKYVKRRLYNDSVELLCIPNDASMRLRTAKNEFFRLVNDLQQHTGQGKKQSPGFSKSFSLTDYNTEDDQLTTACLYFTRLPQFPPAEPFIISNNPFTAEQPPERV